MTLEAVVNQLRNRLGLDPASLGAQAVNSAVAIRQRIAGVPDIAAYAARLSASADEFEALAEELVVSETWFFRGGALFPYLVQTVRQLVAERPMGKPVRILSIPCSTGEEPYSLAIALTEAAIPCAAWRLDAVDFSPRHLDKARRGVYGEFSFRQTETGLREKWFQRVANEWRISAEVKSCVQFRRDNLATPEFLRDESPYDVILCRNLLIYLHYAARQQALANLDRLLAPQGVICMGHAEPLSSMNPSFFSTGPGGAFAFRRGVASSPSERRTLPPALADLPPAIANKPLLPTARASKAPPAPQPAVAIADVLQDVDALTKARRLADAGELDAAWIACQAQLKAGPSAELYALLGTIGQARHDLSEARSCFQKALYLQPDHREALWHLMSLYEQEGAAAQARVLRRRWERAAPGGEA